MYINKDIWRCIFRYCSDDLDIVKCSGACKTAKGGAVDFFRQTRKLCINSHKIKASKLAKWPLLQEIREIRIEYLVFHKSTVVRLNATILDINCVWQCIKSSSQNGTLILGGVEEQLEGTITTNHLLHVNEQEVNDVWTKAKFEDACIGQDYYYEHYSSEEDNTNDRNERDDQNLIDLATEDEQPYPDSEDEFEFQIYSATFSLFGAPSMI